MFLYPIIDYDYYIQKKISLIDLKNKYKPSFFQIRIKNQNTYIIKDFLKKVKNEFPHSLIIMNDYSEFLDETSGLHMGIEDLEMNKNLLNLFKNKNYQFSKSIPEWLNSKNKKILGISTHNSEQFQYIYKEFKNYLGYLAIGPVFPTTTKQSNYSILSEKEISKIIKFINDIDYQNSLVFIGGIQEENLKILYNLIKKYDLKNTISLYYACISSFMNLKIPDKLNFT